MSVEITKEKLSELGKYILSGMSEKESCVMADISYKELQILKEKNEEVRTLMEKLDYKFKYNHLMEIQNDKSPKTSQWILEKLRADEFGPRSRSEGGVTINIASQILKEIQNDNQPIISRRAEYREQSDSDDSDTGLRVAEVLK